jgi:hypothetical protein
MSRLRRRIARVLLNVRRTCTLSEFSGGFGDLGTLLPIITALAINNQVCTKTQERHDLIL